MILLRRQAAGRSRPRQALLVLGMALGAALLLFVYAFPYRSSTQAERWARLRSLADHLAAAPGRAGLDLPGPGWSYRVITRPGEGSDIVEVALNDSWPGRIFGIDLLQLDHVQIHRTPDGIVRSVNVSYF